MTYLHRFTSLPRFPWLCILLPLTADVRVRFDLKEQQQKRLFRLDGSDSDWPVKRHVISQYGGPGSTPLFDQKSKKKKGCTRPWCVSFAIANFTTLNYSKTDSISLVWNQTRGFGACIGSVVVDSHQKVPQ
jgi:hypothetical protein